MKNLKLLLVSFCLAGWIMPVTGTVKASAKQVRVTFSKESAETTERINQLIDAGYKYLSRIDYFEKGKACIDSALAICREGKIEIPARLTLLMAEHSFVTGDFRNASAYAEKALQQSDTRDDREVHAHSLYFLGRYYARTGYFKESIDYLDKAITFSKKNRIKGFVPKSYFVQAREVYNNLKDWEGYLNSLKNLIDEATVESDTAYLIRGYYYLGHKHADTARIVWNFRLADSLLKKSYSLALIRKDTGFIAGSLAMLGWNFYGESMFDSSLYHFNKCLEYTIPAKNYSTTANALGNIATIYRDLGETEKSIDYYARAIEMAEKARDWYSLEWIYLDLTNIYLKLRDTSTAFIHYLQHKRFSDSLLIVTNTKGLTDAKLRYDTDTHKKEIELLSLRIKNQRLMIYGFSGFLVLSLTIGVLLFRGSRLKAKRRISEMNRKISEVTQANLRQQMNPHFIFNTLNSIQYYMYQHDKLATNNYLTKFSSLMRKVLENSRHTSVTLHDELEALNLYLELERIRFKDKFDYEITVDEEIDTLMYKVPTMLIQPYVENSICHGLMPGEEKGIVKIDLKLNSSYINCTIEDNGIGRDAAQKIREKSEHNHNSLGTQIVASRLDLVNSLYGTSLKTIYTDLKDEKGEPEGTRVEIHIPILT
jgi:tetratricopeptide (TPR) repeat protein